LSSGKLTENQLDYAVMRAGLVAASANGWTAVSPVWPNEALVQRTMRAPLASLLKTLDQAKHLRLANLASFVVAQPVPNQWGDVADKLLNAINPNERDTAFEVLIQPAVLKTFASMSPRQRSILLNGGQVTFEELTTNQKQWLIDEMMRVDGGPRAGINGKLDEHVYTGMGISYDRTETLAHGIPNSASIRLNFANQDAAVASNPATGQSDFLTPERIAMQMLQGELKMASNWPAPPTYTVFQPAHMEHYGFTLLLADPIMYAKTYEDYFTDVGSSGGGMDSMSDSFKAQIQAHLKELREAFGNVNGGGAGNSDIPPLED
jgi:hypothetical protein